MADIITWPVVLVCPGEDELPLLADLSARRDARIVAVLDPEGTSLGAGLAEIMGLPVIASLSEPVTGSARYLVHPPLDAAVEQILAENADQGLEAVPAREFAERVMGPRLAPPPPREPSGANLDRLLERLEPRDDDPRDHEADLEFLELETAAIHRTLSRIEEALDREALLRWLLGLATRATGARTGSIMLVDRNAEELYVAFAYGLSQKTMHRTRVRLGEGVAGRVAETRRAELISGAAETARDRAELESAICAPIVWDGEVLGIVNVSTSRGEPSLDKGALQVLESLTHRFGLILDRFLSIQTTSDRELLRELEETFTRDAGAPETLATTLCSWAADVGAAAGAAAASLSILTTDGDLFTARPDGTLYETPPPADKSEVLSQGRPRVIRPGDRGGAGEGGEERTIFHLPVGRDPLRALLTLEFDAAAAAHHFHSVSSDILLLLNRHLHTFLDRASTADQLDRLTALAAALSELGAATPGPDTHEQVLSAARRLTGAAHALLLTGDEQIQHDPQASGDAETALTREAVRLLSDAGQSRWQSTVLDTAQGGGGRSIMAVPLGDGDPFPGLVLWDKHRLHPLDGAVFTEFDALFARRLLPLLADRLNRRPSLSDVDTAGLADSLEPAEPVQEPVSASEDALAEILRREMDRCDRYHTMLGLAAFRLRAPADEPVDTGHVVRAIDRHLRSSDHTGALEDGTILVIVPEDIQSMPRLQKRVVELLRGATGRPDLDVAHASRVYPGGGDTPRKLLSSVLGALR